MADIAHYRHHGRLRRHRRVRKKLRGTAERPRLTVYRSNKHIGAQIVDDIAGHTLVAASSVEPGVDMTSGSNIEAATSIGKLLAERAKSAGIDTVVFDRGGYQYHGRVAALADGAREAGLTF